MFCIYGAGAVFGTEATKIVGGPEAAEGKSPADCKYSCYLPLVAPWQLRIWSRGNGSAGGEG